MHTSEETSAVPAPYWLLEDPDVSGGAFRLYMIMSAIANKVNPDQDPHEPRTITTSRKEIAARIPGRTKGSMGPSLVSIDKWMAELVDAGAVTVEPRFGDDGGRVSNAYTVQTSRAH